MVYINHEITRKNIHKISCLTTGWYKINVVPWYVSCIKRIISYQNVFMLILMRKLDQIPATYVEIITWLFSCGFQPSSDGKYTLTSDLSSCFTLQLSPLSVGSHSSVIHCPTVQLLPMQSTIYTWCSDIHVSPRYTREVFWNREVFWSMDMLVCSWEHLLLEGHLLGELL